MAEQDNKPAMDPAPAAVDGAADNDVAIEKEQLQHLDRASTKDGPRPFQAPEIIRSMSPEDRDAFREAIASTVAGSDTHAASWVASGMPTPCSHSSSGRGGRPKAAKVWRKLSRMRPIESISVPSRSKRTVG